MKSFNSLIKLHKHKVEERQKALSELLAIRQDLEARSEALTARLAAEQANAHTAQPHAAADLAAFSTGARRQQDTIAASVANIDEEMTVAHSALRAAFQELKKYELLEASRAAQERRNAARRESADLDEIAGVRAAERKAV